MRLGIVAPEFPPAVGGVQVYTYEVAAELARRGHELTVFTLAGKADADAFPFKVVPALHERIYADEPLLRTIPVDLWHGATASCAWLVRLGLPVTLTVHGNDFLAAYSPVHRLDLRERLRIGFGSRLDFFLSRLLGRWRLYRDLPRAAHVFSNSEYVRRRLEQAAPRCRGRTSVAGVGVDSEFFAAGAVSRATAGPVRLVTAARLDEPRKNIGLLLRAVARLGPGQDWRLTIIGEGERRPEFQLLATQLGIANRVFFTGAIGRGELIAAFASADLFVLTPAESARSVEGLGLVFLEANACGTPVLAARTGGITEAVAESVSGFFVDELSESGLASALTRFIAGEIRFDRTACRSHASRFTWAAVADRMQARWETLRAERPARAVR